MGHSRLRWSRPRLGPVRFNSDSDRQLSKRDPALRATSGKRHGGHQYLRVEHVHVNDGGQAVIGNVKTPDTQG
jgi:hypothetical protein